LRAKKKSPFKPTSVNFGNSLVELRIIVLWSSFASWGVRGDFLSYPAQKEQLTTAHIIGHRLQLQPSSSQSLVIPNTRVSNAAERRRVCAPAP